MAVRFRARAVLPDDMLPMQPVAVLDQMRRAPAQAVWRAVYPRVCALLPFATEHAIIPLPEQVGQAGEDSTVAPMNFLLLGLGGMALALVVFDGAWTRRFRAVRRPLVHDKRKRVEE